MATAHMTIGRVRPRSQAQAAALPQAFIEVLADEVGSDEETVVGMKEAVLHLYWSVFRAVYAKVLRSTKDEASAIARCKPLFDRAAAEIERETRGLPFRVDTKKGPLFVCVNGGEKPHKSDG